MHLSLYNNGESMVRYEDRFLDLIIEAAQTELKYGITTVRDSYGALLPLIAVRDSIAHGKLIGPRMLVAGNIVGWGGPKSPLFSNATPTTFFDEQMMDFIAQGAGEELLDMSPDELRVAMRAYLDKGPNFVKYGGTSHTNNLITFSPRQQEALVDEVHKRGLFAETHSTNPEPLRISVLAGIDLIQHPEVHSVPIPDDLVKLIVDRKVICSILSNSITGKPWKDYLKTRQRADSAKADSVKNDTLKVMQRAKTGWELRNEKRTPGDGHSPRQRREADQGWLHNDAVDRHVSEQRAGVPPHATNGSPRDARHGDARGDRRSRRVGDDDVAGDCRGDEERRDRVAGAQGLRDARGGEARRPPRARRRSARRHSQHSKAVARDARRSHHRPRQAA